MASRDYDTVVRSHLTRSPRDWMPLLGLDPALELVVIDANLATVVSEADQVFDVRTPDGARGIVHVEVQKAHDSSMPVRLYRYNGLLRAKFDCPVLSILVLLSRDAPGRRFGGEFAESWFDGTPLFRFHYRVIRVWEQPAAELARSLGTLPLTALAVQSIEELVKAVHPTLAAMSDPPTLQERESLNALILLASLNFAKEFVMKSLAEKTIKDSWIYQDGRVDGLAEGLAEGRVDEARRIVLRLATRKFGAPDAAMLARLASMTDTSQLEAVLDRVLTAASWEELLRDQP